MTVNTDKKRRIFGKADEDEEKQKLHHLSISQSIIIVNKKGKKKKRRRISLKEEEEEKGAHLSTLFPHDIMLNILSRLPVKSLMRFRSVSKSWNYLIRMDQFFINMHLSFHSKLQHEKMILIDRDCKYRLYSLDYNQGSNQLERLIHHNSRLRHIHRDENYIWGSCNGLICTGATSELDLFISNPSTTEYRKIPYFKRDLYGSCCGFGYNPIDNDYVVVKLIKCKPFLSTVVIYSLRNNSWKKIQDIPYVVDDRFRPGELLYSSLHWVAHSKFVKSENSEDEFDRKENAILSFEITTKIFVEVPCPDDHQGIMLVGQYQGKLCFYHDKEINNSFDLWVMNKYKVRESWSKVYNIRKPFSCYFTRCVLGSTKEGYILMKSNVFGDDHLILYDPKQKTRRHIPGIKVYGAVNYYVPSIVAFG